MPLLRKWLDREKTLKMQEGEGQVAVLKQGLLEQNVTF